MVMYMIELKSIIVLFVNILKSEQVDSGRPDLAVMKPFEYKFCTHTPNSLNQNTVLIGYSVLIGHFSSMSTKLLNERNKNLPWMLILETCFISTYIISGHYHNITDLVLKMALNTNNSILCIPNKTSGIKSLYAQISQKLKFKDFFCHRIISFTLWEGHLFLYTLFVFQW